MDIRLSIDPKKTKKKTKSHMEDVALTNPNRTRSSQPQDKEGFMLMNPLLSIRIK